MNNVNEVVHINTCETSIEIGSPTGGRVKFPLTNEEVECEDKALAKIEKLGRLMAA
jgi:hypothetical protein